MIGSKAFSVCTALTSVTLPHSLTQIDDEAFAAALGFSPSPSQTPSLGLVQGHSLAALGYSPSP
eukprot:CAMPEP_0113258994 /NCGR_PEP_ID=MMETSP0008_2-20120614/16123_1 /TAXON_ID=97485 /ORGANISM="Prymnesium parvum" /LENGTH=63 /DNA_ID=CAMNT_0000107499 /DNA_START=33 /DNA_END=221 /DNA_ORIENTATION=- /assembly_acc=CAM_ASM_000153